MKQSLITCLKLLKLKPKKILVVSSSCIYDENGKYNPNEYSLFRGVPEESNKGYGWAKRFWNKNLIYLLQKSRLNYILLGHSTFMENGTVGKEKILKPYQC